MVVLRKKKNSMKRPGAAKAPETLQLLPEERPVQLVSTSVAALDNRSVPREVAIPDPSTPRVIGVGFTRYPDLATLIR